MVSLNQPAQVPAASALFVIVAITPPPLTGWGLVAKSVLTDASPHVGFSVTSPASASTTLQQQLRRPPPTPLAKMRC